MICSTEGHISYIIRIRVQTYRDMDIASPFILPKTEAPTKIGIRTEIQGIALSAKTWKQNEKSPYF